MSRSQYRADAAIDRTPLYVEALESIRAKPLWVAPTRIQRPARRLSWLGRLMYRFV